MEVLDTRSISQLLRSTAAVPGTCVCVCVCVCVCHVYVCHVYVCVLALASYKGEVEHEAGLHRDGAVDRVCVCALTGVIHVYVWGAMDRVPILRLKHTCG